jgi:UDP-glucose 4-epimerase
LANVYGPRQDPFGEAGVIAIFFKKLLQNSSLQLNGGGSQTRDFVYVKDVVQALLLGLNPTAQGIYNVGTGIATSIKSLLFLQAEICKIKPNYEITPPLSGEVMRNALSYAHLKQELGWQPIYDLSKGLEETKQWCATLENL